MIYRLVMLATLLLIMLAALSFGAILSAPESQPILAIAINSYSYEPQWLSYDVNHRILGEEIGYGYNLVVAPDENLIAAWSHNGSLRWIVVWQFDETGRSVGGVSVVDNSRFVDFTPPVWSPRLHGNYAQLAFATNMNPDAAPDDWRLSNTDIWIQEIPTTRWMPENWIREPESETPSSVNNLGGERWRVTNDEFDEHDLTWSPDGVYIAYVSEHDGNSEIYLVEVETGVIQRLTDNLALERFPTWSPDGEWLAFISDRDGETDIYRMNISSREVQRLTSTVAEERTPQWSPDGSYHRLHRRKCFISDICCRR